MRTVPVFGGYFAYVDDVDYPLVVTKRWHLHNQGYAIGGEGNVTVYMHRLIRSAALGTEVDHVNNNKLDNRRVNLRIATRAQNESNKPKLANRTSQYKGVYWESKAGTWRAQIKSAGKNHKLGSFKNEADAARAYDAAARQYHDGFARLNFPEVN